MISAKIPTTPLRIALAPAKIYRRSIRSTNAPIGIAKSSQGSITIAPIAEIKTGLSVNEIASSGTAASMTPSERFETMLEVHIRLNAGFITRTLLCQLFFPQYRQILTGLIRISNDNRT